MRVIGGENGFHLPDLDLVIIADEFFLGLPNLHSIRHSNKGYTPIALQHKLRDLSVHLWDPPYTVPTSRSSTASPRTEVEISATVTFARTSSTAPRVTTTTGRRLPPSSRASAATLGSRRSRRILIPSG